MLGLEPLGIHLVEGAGEVLAHAYEVLVLGVDVVEGVHLDDDLQAGHFRLGESLPDDLVHEEDLGLGMVDQIVDILGFEFVQEGYGDGAVGQGGQETDAPVGLVAGAEGHLVALLQAAFLESDVQQLDALRHIGVFERDALVVGEGFALPILFDALLEQFVY